MSYYHCTHLNLGEGETIQPGNWGKILFNIGPNHISWKRELMLEAIRAEHYPEKPSRLYSCFGCYSLETIKLYQKLHCPEGYIYEVELIEHQAPIHTGDFNAVEPMPRHHANMIQIAFGYWKHEFKTEIDGWEQIDCSEFVTTSTLRILRKL